MSATTTTGRLVLQAMTAKQLMSANPISISARATVSEATAMLTDKGFGAVPVIDEAGRPVGVLSKTDLLIHDRARTEYRPDDPDLIRSTSALAKVHGKEPADLQVVNVDRTEVRDLMTPAVFAVSAETCAHKVVREMLSLHVHQLFVTDKEGVLVGVITTLDVMRHLRAEE